MQDLGFTLKETKAGDVIIYHHGKQATILRGSRAQKILMDLESLSFEQQQQLIDVPAPDRADAVEEENPEDDPDDVVDDHDRDLGPEAATVRPGLEPRRPPGDGQRPHAPTARSRRSPAA